MTRIQSIPLPQIVFAILLTFFAKIVLADGVSNREIELIQLLTKNPSHELARLEYAALLFERDNWVEASRQAGYVSKVNPENRAAKSLQASLKEILAIQEPKRRKSFAQEEKLRLLNAAVASLKQATEDLKKDLGHFRSKEKTK